jgi:hypothetical protein
MTAHSRFVSRLRANRATFGAMGTPRARRGDGAASGKKRATKRWPYRFAMVELGSLFVDHEYQRPLTTFANEVIDEYDPALLGTLIVSERDDGTYAVIDGQTRLAGMAANEEPAAPCLIYHGLTREDEAKLFADLQVKRRGMATYLRFRASLVAKDPEALAIRSIVQGAGFELDVDETAHTVKSIAALENVYRKDPGLLRRVMDTIAATWPDPTTEARSSGDLIRGLALFLERERHVDDERLVSRLSAITPRMLRHRANALQEGAGGGSGRPGYMADAILGIYMRGKGTRAIAA